MIYDDDGWMFQAPDHKPNNDVHMISEDQLQEMYEASLDDDVWADAVRRDVIQQDQHPDRRRDFILNEIEIQNTGGTVICYPFGERIITFPSKRHFFRGENQVYAESLPSLRRKVKGMDARSRELYHCVANMRINQFGRFIWQFNIVPYWEAKLCDVNFMALAQHYGFETCLLDLTNDFMTALFFATCYYDRKAGEYRPLTEEMIHASGNTKYGVLFHSPHWVIGSLEPECGLRFFAKHWQEIRTAIYPLDSGEMDGMAFQIGYQPLHRCHSQNGYIFPMKDARPLQEDNRFEKLRFRQSAELSRKVFDYMDAGRKVFPNEGINAAEPVLQKIQTGTTFSDANLKYAFYYCNKAMFESEDSLKKALEGFETAGERISFQPEEVEYPISEELKNEINSQYDGVDLLKAVGGVIHQHPEDRDYRKQRCIEIYGREI